MKLCIPLLTKERKETTKNVSSFKEMRDYKAGNMTVHPNQLNNYNMISN